MYCISIRNSVCKLFHSLSSQAFLIWVPHLWKLKFWSDFYANFLYCSRFHDLFLMFFKLKPIHFRHHLDVSALTTLEFTGVRLPKKLMHVSKLNRHIYHLVSLRSSSKCYWIFCVSFLGDYDLTHRVQMDQDGSWPFIPLSPLSLSFPKHLHRHFQKPGGTCCLTPEVFASHCLTWVMC